MATEFMNWQIGDVKVTRLCEYEGQLRPGYLIANIDADRLEKHASWLKPDFMKDDGRILLSFYTFIIESAGKTIVLDTGLGNDRMVPSGIGTLHTNYLTDLEKIVKCDAVDYVMFTHLHYDHVGWNTMLVDGNWVPTFPKSKYLFPREEYEDLMRHGVMDKEDLIRIGVQPIIDAALFELVDQNSAITEEVFLEPSPGHSLGHMSVKIESKGARAIITGDVFHHPVQIAEPTWGSHADLQPELATRTRRDFIAKYGDTDVLVIGSHFTGATAGHIRKKDDSYRLKCSHY